MYYSPSQFSMFCHEDGHIILDFRHFKTSLFFLLPFNDVIWNYLLGNSTTTKSFTIQKKIIRIMAGTKTRISCRELLKFNILPLASEYMSLLLFVAGNKEKFHTNSEIYSRNTRNTHDFHIPNSNPTSYQNGVYYSENRLFNALPPYIKMLKHDRKAFKTALKII
jgi:hypothetical protein